MPKKTTQPSFIGCKNHRRPHKALLLLGAAMTLAPMSGWAEDLVSDEILVTADRLNRPAQDTPVFLTLFDSDNIERLRIVRTDDFAALVPNFVLDDAFTGLTTTGTFRGLSQLDNGDPPYAIVVDGVPLTTQREFNFSLFDVERIEVASGPQGALYGRSAIAGAIIINTRNASEEWSGGASVSYGVGAQIRATGNISGPLNDRVAMRLATVFTRDNGRLENEFLQAENDFVDHDVTVRGGLDIQLSDRINVDFRAQYRDFDMGSIRNSFVPSNDANDFQPPTANRLGTSEGHALNTTLKVTADLDFGALTSISNFSDQNEFTQGDLDFSNILNNPADQSGQFFDSNVQAFSQEIRLASDLEQRFTWLVGASFLQSDIDFPAVLPFFDNGEIYTFEDFDLSTCTQPGNFCFFQDIDTITNTYGFFGQAQFAVTERFDIGVALRYDEDERTQRNFLNDTELRETFNGFQPSVRLSYDLGDQLVYASWGRAFLPGGFNTPPREGFEEQTVDTIDVGVKTQWLDGRLTLNGAFFYSWVDGYQFFFLDPPSQVLDNIDEVEIYGVEIQARAQLTDGLNFHVALGTTDTEIIRNDLFPETEGNSVPRSLDYTLNIGLDINQPLTAEATLVGSIGYERRGDRVWSLSNNFVQQPIDLLNARIGVDKGRYNLSFFGKNLTDEVYFVDFSEPASNGRGTSFGHLNRPREYGVEFSVSF